MLSLIEDIFRDLETVTDAELDRETRRLKPLNPTSNTLGEIHNMNARRLFALAHRYEAAESLAHHNYTHVAPDDSPEEEEARLAIARYHCLHKLAMEIFWAQCREDISGSAWTSHGVGLRAGWVMVARSGRNPHSALSGLTDTLNSMRELIEGMGGKMSGPFPLPPGMILPPGMGVEAEEDGEEEEEDRE